MQLATGLQTPSVHDRLHTGPTACIAVGLSSDGKLLSSNLPPRSQLPMWERVCGGCSISLTQRCSAKLRSAACTHIVTI